jgi:ABC-type oligopeptide transport system substrate-binding subunit
MDVQIKAISNGASVRAGRRGEPFDMAVSSWYADLPDPLNFLGLLDGRTIAPEGNLNLAYFDQPAYNRSLDAAAALPSPARELALGRLDARVARTAAPWAAVANERSHDFFSDRVGCQSFHPIFGMNLGALCIRPD